ncbi:MAG: tetratricopeptide repeat protein [Alphaproteobacteria bacterium]|nr:tetratricopeptide repeat protein [Alphaproteobacteria bacterium]
MPLLLLLIVFSILILIKHTKNLRKKMIFKFIEKNILSSAPMNQWYSSITIDNVAKKLNRLSKKKLSPIFSELKKQNFAPLIKHCQDNELNLICRKKISNLSPLIKAELAFAKFEFGTCESLLEKIKPKNKQEKARILLIKSGLSLNDGDLESASIHVNSAINMFKKLCMQAEEAKAYLLCGIIYKACAMNDTAQMMMKTAADLFADIGANAGYAESLGNIGMLMVQQNRYSEADDYFNQALSVFLSINDVCGATDIYNQLAIMNLITKDLKKSKQFADQASKVLPTKHNKGKALNLDIYAQIACAKSQWKTTLKNAKLAEETYISEKNFSATLEMMHLQAQALINLKQLSAAEKILRKTITIAQSKQTCFHIANTYNLLGIIYLQQNNLSCAKTWFNKALETELYNDRWGGAAIDYANIALTEYRKGECSAGDKNKLEALRLAKESGDNELLKMLENKFINL